MTGRNWFIWQSSNNYLSRKGGWCLLLNDGLLLHNFSLSLSDIAGLVSVELQPCIVSVSDHRAKPKESCCSVRCSVHRRHRDWSDEIKHRPESAENQLNLNPRNSEVSLNDVKDVKHKQNPCEPKARHRHDIEKCSTRKACITRDFNANEA